MTHPISPSQSDTMLDTSIRPQDDFFQHVNGRWLAAHPIPAAETRWGTFNILRDDAWKAMRQIYEELDGQDYPIGTIEQQARDFYYTGIHYDELEKNHLELLADLHHTIDAVTTTTDLSRVLGQHHKMDIGGFWQSYVDSDQDDSKVHVFHFRQGGLSLPNRDYYLEDSDKMRTVRAAYKAHTAEVYEHFPALAPSADDLWERLIAFETAIATIARPSADLRDVEKNYHKTTYAQLTADYPSIDWTTYAEALGWQADDKITVEQPEYMAFVDTLFKTGSLDDITLYLKWRVTSQCLGKLSSRFSDLAFTFYGKVLSGTTEITPLWKRVVLTTEYAIGDGTGRLYAERHFPEASKKQVLSLVESVRSAYGERIDSLDWMSDDTKAYAKKKLANTKVLIGYPDQWRDFSGLTIGRKSYLGNALAANALDVGYWLKKLHEPTSRDEWFMTPQTVNAYNDPNRLVICFPAGILQKPFFDPQASLATNMGGIGTVIGHELSHGFDDQGCMYDAEGNVRTWQTADERAAFAEKAQVIVDQADHFEVLPGLTLKGKLVLGESIADLGGLEIALHALKQHIPDSVEQIAAIRAFLTNYAFTECTNIREEKLREYTLTDPHPASEFRVNGMLQHVDDFYSAFDVHESDALYRPRNERARIW